uniref:Uncharacterized protein n=1 Tax=Ficedula albicollis TaxID=59894 RepID=A0A803VL72_FICAL
MVRVLGCLNYYYFDFLLSSIHLEGYSDCLLSTSWRKRTTHLIQVSTHLFSSVWGVVVHLRKHKSPSFVCSFSSLCLVWDQAKLSLYNWLWYETTTFNPYVEETSYENSLLVQQSGSLALSSLMHVLHSLTLNARGIFRLLAQHQLEKKDNPSYPGGQYLV